ncbi:MAG: hypothetical protein HQM09_06550, partial [Candidatus Riflebacteria bacterium]|nr:hypothetical protein [Candidatus Riflebacteria bacterium]
YDKKPVSPAVTGVSIFPDAEKDRNISFSFADSLHILQLKEKNSYEPNLVRKTFRFWMNEGALGLDDARYLDGAASAYGLFESIDAFELILRNVEVARQEVTGRD